MLEHFDTLDQSFVIPDPEAIRAAIDVADERSKLLRRLLRVALRLRSNQMTSKTGAQQGVGERGVARADR